MAVDIYSFHDYREYLKAFLEAKKVRHSTYSIRQLARDADIKSSGFLSSVFKSEKNLSTATVLKLAKALKLGKKKSAYFEAMVFNNQAATVDERNHYLERMIALKPMPEFQGLSADQFEFLSKPFYSVIHQMVKLPGFKGDPEWIAKRLFPRVSVEEVELALEALLKLKLLEKKQTKGIRQSHAGIATDADVASKTAYKFHWEILNEAKTALIKLPASDRNLTSLTIPIPKKVMPELKEKFMEFKKEVSRLIQDNENPFDEVYRLNLQLYPVTKKSKK
jgi:uncharacterized protein (TIGR02147 family)